MSRLNNESTFQEGSHHIQMSSDESDVGRLSEESSNPPLSDCSSDEVLMNGVQVNYENDSKQNELTQIPCESFVSSSPTINHKRQKDSRYVTALMTFLLVSIVSAVLVMGLEGFMFGALTMHRHNFASDEKYFEISIFLALFIFAAVYQCIITVVGLVTKNMLLLSMLCIFYMCMLVYTGIQFKEISSRVVLVTHWETAVFATNVTTIVVLAATLISQVLLIYFALWKDVKWFRFKKIGASFEIKRLYSYFQIHRSLLMFDFFFFLGFTVQFIVIMISDKTSVEFILTCIILPLTVIVLVASDFAASREWLWLTVVTTLCFLAGLSYVLFKIIRLFTKYTSAYNTAVIPGEYFPGRSSLVTFGVITILFLVATIVMEIVMINNYGRGLLLYVNNYFASKSSKKSEEAALPVNETESMIID